MALRMKRTFLARTSNTGPYVINKSACAMGAVLVAGMMFAFCGTANAQTAFASAGESQSAPGRAAQSADEVRATTTSRADAYFNYTMGHIAEQQYEQTSRGEYATQAIEYYKKAYALDPKSPVIGERLAEMDWKAQRGHEAESEAQALLKREPNDVQAPRVLGHIQLPRLG